MSQIKRKIYPLVQQTLQRGKSILLLGPRQTGKTTFVTEFIKPDITISLVKLETRARYEKDIAQFEKDLLQQLASYKHKPLIFVDEIQKIPLLMDSVQYFIDAKQAQFILSGSSARKLKHGPNINLLPGRVVNIIMDSLVYSELPLRCRNLETLLAYGSLPAIITEVDNENRENDLLDYVSTYLEEEIRQEALVRNLGAFARFLELAAIEAGNAINFTKISQDIGVSDHTIKEYFQILEDCLIATKIIPITETTTRRKLLKAPKYLFFDLAVRRLAANEGSQASIKQHANWFEQYVGMEVLRLIHLNKLAWKLKYWRDAGSVEIDYVIDTGNEYIPIEVKWSLAPKERDARHLVKFIAEYENCAHGYIVCRTPRTYRLLENIEVISWEMLAAVLAGKCNNLGMVQK